MAELRQVSDSELEASLRDAGSRYPYPPTPNLAHAVRARIVLAPAVPATSRRVNVVRPWRLALVAGLVLVFLAGAALLNRGTRDAIAHFFHVRGVVVTKASALPSVSVSSLNLGQPTSLERAQSLVSFISPELFLKVAGPDTHVEETSVNGDPAWWLAGHPHVIIVQTTPEDYREERLRLAANTLVWEDESVTLRIESGLSKSDAMDIATHMP
ncbi:MAG: hypothetical protein E6I88_12315 [Chloroflexi bacterium]|nr:MAG: hypothetical protein E6I88_12315 [Chloroflexota bacterium]